jgi:hypothetical protein
MAKPNYAFAKRQRDLAKKQKKEEKLQKKLAAKSLPGEGEAAPAEEGTAAPEPEDKPPA